MGQGKAAGPNYDILLNWQITHLCNLRCRYCFRFTSTRFRQVFSVAGMRAGGFVRRLCSTASGATVRVPPIDIAALIPVLDRTGKAVHVGFSGGEPFLVPNIIEASAAIAQRHFVGFSTNLITGNIREFARRIDPARVAGVLASLHMQELERLKLVGLYIDNFHACRQNGIAIRAAQVAHPALLRNAQAYRLFLGREGIALSFSPFRGYYKGRHYPDSYTPDELREFGLDGSCRSLLHTRGSSCNAGVNVAVVSPAGAVYPCFNIKKGLGGVYSGIRLQAGMTRCPAAHCKCPFFDYEKQLYLKALAATGGLTGAKVNGAHDHASFIG